MDEVEKKSLTKDEMNKEIANKEYNPEEKEVRLHYSYELLNTE